jgi:hypothetical protein
MNHISCPVWQVKALSNRALAETQVMTHLIDSRLRVDLKSKSVPFRPIFRVAWIAGNQASHIHFLRIARADIHPFLVISMAISLWLCPLFMIWYVYEAGFKPAIVLLCIALALRLPLIALERLALQGSEWRISIGGIVAVPVLLVCLVLLILQQS